MSVGFDLVKSGEMVVQMVKDEALKRAYPASNELRNAAMYVLRGQRSGKQYRVPNTKQKYTASKPGEPPAVRTGALRASWFPRPTSNENGDVLSVKPSVHSNIPYNKYLEPAFGNGRPPRKVLPRPYVDAIKDRAKPAIERIYKSPYVGG